MSKSNRILWDKFKATDPGYTKEVNNGRHTFTNVDAHWQLEKATEEFGPYGDRWGLRNMQFSTIETSDGVVSATLIAEFFYPLMLQQGEASLSQTASFPIAVDLKFRHGDDCYKKLITTARSKALSYIGMSADVYLGKFEDDAYVKDARVKYEDQEAFVKKARATIAMAKTKPDLNRIRDRVTEMVGNEAISGDIGRDLLDDIDARMETLK
jgi:hypothetical protein